MNLLHNFFPLFVALDFRLDTFIIYLFRPFEFGLNHGVTNAQNYDRYKLCTILLKPYVQELIIMTHNL